jgi:hypothetical protein
MKGMGRFYTDRPFVLVVGALRSASRDPRIPAWEYLCQDEVVVLGWSVLALCVFWHGFIGGDCGGLEGGEGFAFGGEGLQFGEGAGREGFGQAQV